MRDRTDSENNYLRESMIPAAAGIICSIIIMLYRIPLAKILGTEGISYYTFTYAVYSVMLIISSYALPGAISRLMSVRLMSGRAGDAHRVFGPAMTYACFSGGAFFIIFYFIAPFISALTGREFLSNTLKALAPAVWIMACSGVLRGYFQGIGAFRLTAVSQIAEQVINGIASVFLAANMFNYGYKADLIYDDTGFAPSYGAAGATYGLSCGALFALLFLTALYFSQRGRLYSLERGHRGKKTESLSHIRLAFSRTAFPVIIWAILFNITVPADDIIFNLTASFSGSDISALSLWGSFGKFLTFFYIAQLAANSPGAILIPVISDGAARRDKRTIVSAIISGFKTVFNSAVPLCVAIAALADPLCRLLFGPEDIELVRVLTSSGSVFILLFVLATVSTNILQGLGHVSEPLMNTVTGLIIHVVLLLALILGFKPGIYAVIWANAIFYAVIFLLNIMCIRRHVKFRYRLYRGFLSPFLRSFLAGAVVYGLNLLLKLVFPELFYESRPGLFIVTAVCVFLFGTIYASLGTFFPSRRMR